MSGCHYPSPPPQERDRRYQHKVSLVVRYFMIPCNICLILLATSTLGFAVLLFLNNCSSDNSPGFCLVSQTAELTARVQMVVWFDCALYSSVLTNLLTSHTPSLLMLVIGRTMARSTQGFDVRKIF
ncbi:hypothetical protein PAMP_011685 [Pampus punctatissimus]